MKTIACGFIQLTSSTGTINMLMKTSTNLECVEMKALMKNTSVLTYVTLF